MQEKGAMIKKWFLLKTVNLITNHEKVHLYALVLELPWTWSWRQSKAVYGVCMTMFFGGGGSQWCLLWPSERSFPHVLQSQCQTAPGHTYCWPGLSPAAMVVAHLRLCQPIMHRMSSSREMVATLSLCMQTCYAGNTWRTSLLQILFNWCKCISCDLCVTMDMTRELPASLSGLWTTLNQRNSPEDAAGSRSCNMQMLQAWI